MSELKNMPGMDDYRRRNFEVRNFLEMNNMHKLLKSTLAYIIPGRQPEIRMQIGGNSYVDNNLIILALPDEYVLEDFNTIYIALMGMLGHYSQHYLSTNGDEFDQVTAELIEYLAEKNMSRNLAKKTVIKIATSIEAARVDKILCRKLPGMKKNIKMLRIHHWEWSRPIGVNEYLDIVESIDILAQIGRYPKNYEGNYKNKRLDKLLDEIKPLIIRGINSVKCIDALNQTRKIIYLIGEYIEDYFEDLEEDIRRAEELEDFIRNIREDGEFKSNKEVEFNYETTSRDLDDLDDFEDIKDEIERIELNEEDEIELDADSEIEVNKDNQPLDNLERLKEMILEESKEEISKLNKIEIEDELDDRDEQSGEITDEDVSGIIQGYGNLYDYKYEKNDFPLINLPRSLQFESKRFRKDVEDIFKNRSRLDLLEQNQGLLNQDDIYKVEMNNYDIFIDEGVKKESDYVGYILHDGSYSMHRNNKYELSLEALAILEEGLKGIIPLKIVSFRASNIAIHRLIKDFDENSRKNYSYSFYKNSKPENANEDGFSIEIATKELMDRDETDKLLVILSDGMPMNKKKVKKAVKEARRKGVYVFAIFFGTEEFRMDHRIEYEDMYQNNIISSSPELIPRKLTNLFKKILIR